MMRELERGEVDDEGSLEYRGRCGWSGTERTRLQLDDATLPSSRSPCGLCFGASGTSVMFHELTFTGRPLENDVE